jgi:hypothetical protein
VSLLFALLFTILKEKGAMLVSGFNTMPKEKRALYDTAKISKDQRNAFLIWAGRKNMLRPAIPGWHVRCCDKHKYNILLARYHKGIQILFKKGLCFRW